MRAAGAAALDTLFPYLRAPPILCAQALELLEASPVSQRRSLELGLAEWRSWVLSTG